MGFKPGIVTNAYWATSEADAELCLEPLVEAGLSSLVLSDDGLHYGDEEKPPPANARAVAKRLGVPFSVISTEKPSVGTDDEGHAIIKGGVLFKGRAVEKLADGLPRRPYAEFTECPVENLREPGRVHVDVYGHVHICQGISMGNLWETPLSDLVAAYDPDAHPICGPMLRGGPARLAQEHGVEHDDEYISACHFCYAVRLALLDRFPRCLAPPQVYGR
jgi:hypothetical protein